MDCSVVQLVGSTGVNGPSAPPLLEATHMQPQRIVALRNPPTQSISPLRNRWRLEATRAITAHAFVTSDTADRHARTTDRHD